MVTPQKPIMFDTKGRLHKNRLDVKADPTTITGSGRCVCECAIPACIYKTEEAVVVGAYVLIALSTPGPNVVKSK